MSAVASRARIRGSPRQNSGALWHTLLPPTVAFILFTGLWQGAVSFFELPSYLVPAPADVIEAFASEGTTIATATWLSFRSSAIALLISVAVGVVALLLASSKLLYQATFPYTVVLQTTPVIAVAPIIIVWFGIGLPAIATIAVIICVFPVIANTTTGLRSTEPKLLHLFQLYHASRWQVLWKLQLPYAMPYFFAGVRIAAGLAVIGAIVGEYVAGMGPNHGGLGFIIVESANRLRMGQVFEAALASALLGVGFLVAINTVSHFVLRRWHASAGAHEA